MNIPYYQVDAFVTKDPFSGNPAGVCILDEWLPDDVLQGIALENNLSETAFVIDQKDYYDLRWFTPTLEVDLCGHATLAPAHLIMNLWKPGQSEVKFKSKSGDLFAQKEGELTRLDFPSRPPEKCDPPAGLVESMGLDPVEILTSRDVLLLYESEEQVRSLDPDMNRLGKVDCFSAMATAKGNDCDFVSRFFAPAAGVPEDPVTGSAHSTLVPFWAERLNKNKLHARQISPRGGEIFCTLEGDRVLMAGSCRVFMKGEITL